MVLRPSFCIRNMSNRMKGPPMLHYGPYLDFTKSHMMISPLRALVSILLLNSVACKYEGKRKINARRTAVTPGDISAGTVYLETAAFPEIARGLYSMTTTSNGSFMLGSSGLCRIQDGQYAKSYATFISSSYRQRRDYQHSLPATAQ